MDKDNRSDRSLQRSSARSSSSDDSSVKEIEREPRLPKSTVCQTKLPLATRSDPMEDVLPHRPETNKEPAQGQEGRYNGLADPLPTNPGITVEEPDGDTKATDSALSGNRLTRNSFNETPKLPTLDFDQPTLPPSELKPTIAKSRYDTTSKPLASPTRAVKRKSSLPRIRRGGSDKSKPMKPQRKAGAVKHAAKQHASRWAISENVSELFSGKLFHKIEADEMLTPMQLEAYKLRRLTKLQLQLQTSEEALAVPALDVESTETPNEPFFMDDLPSRIGSSGVKLTVSTPIEEKADSVPFGGPVKRDFSAQHRDDELFLDNTERSRRSGWPKEESESSYGRAALPVPPVKSQLRYMVRKQLPALPCIPESTHSPATSDEDELFLGSDQSAAAVVADSEFVYLRSSSCTLTVPAFRHGPIRLSKADISPDPLLGADEGLDWTAFQMAILGGAGDWFSDSQDTIREREAEELDDLRDWWDSWCFERTGGLVTHETEEGEDEPPSPTDSTLSGGDLSEFSYAEIERDNPYSAHHGWQRDGDHATAEGRPADVGLPPRTSSRGFWLDTDKLYDGGAIERWSTDWPDDDDGEGRVSLPQSPMLDIQVIRSDNGDVDYVPMGYNLGHDLGDFLRWEAEHVYSDGNLWDGGVI